MAWRTLGGYAAVKEKARKAKWEAQGDAGERGGVEGAHWPDVAWLGRAKAMRGLFSSTRRPWPEGGRPLNRPIQSVQSPRRSLTARFCEARSSNM